MAHDKEPTRCLTDAVLERVYTHVGIRIINMRVFSHRFY